MVTMPGMLGGMFGGGGPNPYAGMNPYGGGMAGFQQMPPAFAGAGSVAGAGSGMPQGPAGIDPNNFMSQLGQGTPQAPTGSWATNPQSAPPWAQAAMAGPGGMQGYLQNQRSQQLAAKGGLPPNILAMLQNANQLGQGPQGMDPRMQAMQAAITQQGQGAGGQMPQGMSGNWGGILSGMMGRGMPPWAQGQPPRGMPRQQMPQPRQSVPRQAPRAPRRASYGGGSAGNLTLSGY